MWDINYYKIGKILIQKESDLATEEIERERERERENLKVAL